MIGGEGGVGEALVVRVRTCIKLVFAIEFVEGLDDIGGGLLILEESWRAIAWLL